MAKKRSSVRVGIVEKGKADQILGAMPIDVREKVLKSALRKAARVVIKEAKRLVPQGDPKHNPGNVSLKDTLKTVRRKYKTADAEIVGPEYPQGAHGHLVEFGHEKVLWGLRTGERVKPKPFLRPAADNTEKQQQAAIIQHLRRELDKLARR